MANLTFKSNGNTVVSFNKTGTPFETTLQYSVNGGTWQDYIIGTTEPISLTNNQTVAFSGSAKFSKSMANRYYFSTSGTGFVSIEGDLSSLVSSATIEDKYQFNSLFKDCKNIGGITYLNFPSNVTEFCYANMFMGCTGLVKAGTTLPAETLKRWSYANMFAGCSNLVYPPTINAVTVDKYSMYCMFMNCQNFTNIALTKITNMDKAFCCNSMFRNCKKLNSVFVNFRNWSGSNNECRNWLKGINPSGRLISIQNVTIPTGYKPSAWTSNIVPTSPLTFKAVGGAANVKLTTQGSPNAITLQYKKGSGDWTNYSVDDIIDLNENETVAFSGANDHFSNNSTNYYKFVMTGSVEAEGNVMSLMNFSNTCPNDALNRLFIANTSLTKAPQFPAIKLGGGSYSHAFEGCTALTAAPSILPAPTVKNYDYQGMFMGCTNLSSVSDDLLPADEVADHCYNIMFKNCSALTGSPKLPAKNTGMIRDRGYYAESVAGTHNCHYCYCEMFQNCISLVSANPISVEYIDFGNGSIQGMFKGCSSLVAPPDMTLHPNWCTYSYAWTFGDCSSLTGIPNFRPIFDRIDDNMFKGTFENCTSLVNVDGLSALSSVNTIWTSGCWGMFQNCTALQSANLNFNSLGIVSGGSCSAMFKGCTNLKDIDVDFGLLSTNGSYFAKEMFSGCTSLTGVKFTLPSSVANFGSKTNQLVDCFAGCSSIVDGSNIKLLPSSFNTSSYTNLFNGCTNLSSVYVGFSNWNGNGTSNWMNGVQTNAGTFYCPNTLDTTDRNVNRVPQNWTVEAI